MVQPSAGSNTVCDVGELVRAVDLNKVLEDGGLDEVGVQLSHTVDLVRADKSQVRHADHLRVRLFDDRDTGKQLAVLGEFALYKLQELEVNVVDDLQVAGEQVLHQRNGPLLQGLGENGVVGVSEGLLDDYCLSVLLSGFR